MTQGEQVLKLTLLFRGKLLKIHHLSEGDTDIGRSADCAICIDSLAVEPRHVRLTLHDGQLTLHNLCDPASVLVNHKPAGELPLHDGDLVLIGKHTLKVTLDEMSELESPPATETTTATSHAAPARVGWLQVLSGPHLGRAFPIEHDQHRIGKPGLPSAQISRANGRYQIVALGGGDSYLDGQALDSGSHTLHDGAIIECGELRLQFFMDQAVSVPTAHHNPPANAAAQRHHTRISFDAHAYLRNETTVWQTQLIDISLKGALLVRPPDWQGAKGEAYLLELLLDDEQTAIHMMTTVMHTQANRIGLHCDHIDIDSITHLRRLIELNLGDPQLLERELSGLA